jgi:hypothetical protein
MRWWNQQHLIAALYIKSYNIDLNDPNTHRVIELQGYYISHYNSKMASTFEKLEIKYLRNYDRQTCRVSFVSCALQNTRNLNRLGQMHLEQQAKNW